MKNQDTSTGNAATALKAAKILNAEKGKIFSIIRTFCLVFMISSFTRLSAQAITGPTVVCANSSHSYTTTYTQGYTYVWSVLGAAANSAISNTLAVTYGLPPVGSGGNVLITLVAKDGNGTTVSTASLVVHVNPTPMPEIVVMSNIGCSAPEPEYDGHYTVTPVDTAKDYCYKVCDSTVFKYKVGSTFDPNHNYTWSVIPASAAIAISATASTGEAEITWGAPSGANSYILRLTETDPLTGCSDSVDICVRIIPRPNAAMSTFPLPDVNGIVRICFNSSVAFFDQSTGDPNSPIASYLWDFGDGSYSTQQFPTHTYVTSGTFFAKLIVENQCHCRDSVIVEIEVHGDPGPVIYCISPTCYNTSDTYCTNYTCTPYNWSVTNGTITSPTSPGSTTSTCIDVTWGANGPGIITLTPDPSCGGCPYPTSALVPILTPTSAITGPNPACENSISFYNVPQVPGTTYNWQVVPANSGTIVSGQGNHLVGIDFGAGPVNCTVQVIYTNLFLGCSGSAQLPVKVGPKMTITGDNVLCAGTTGTYSAISSSADWWIVSPSGSTVYTQSGVSSISYNFSTGGAYVVYALDVTGNFCASPQAYQVQVIAQPPIPSANISTVICPGSVIQYIATPTNNNYFLNWQVTGGTPNQASGNSISVLWGATSPWQISLTQQQVMPPSCASAPLVVNLSLPTVPTPTINTNNSTPCFNQSVNYTSAFSAGSYTWQIAPSSIGSIAQGAGTGAITVQYNNGTNPAVASIMLTVEDCGITSSTVYTVMVGSPAVPSIVVPNLCSGQSANFSTSPSPSGTYAWAFGDGGTGSGNSPNHTYLNPGPYTVSLSVTNPNGCIGTVSTSKLVNVNQTPVANITTPDPLQFCANGPYNITLYASLQTMGSTATYTWQHNGNPVGNGTTLSVTQAGMYTLLVEANGCIYSTFVNVDDNFNCNPPPPCPLADPNSTLTIDFTLSCNSATFGLSNINPAGNLIQWQFDPNNQVSNAANPVITYDASGYYNVWVTYEFPRLGGGWCPVTFNTLVTVPVVGDFKHDFSCGSSGLNVNFIDQSNWIGTTPSFSWSATPGTYNSSSQDYLVNNMPANTYVVTHTTTGGGQSCIVTKTVVVPQLPTAGFTATNSICEGNPVIFVNTSSPTAGIAQYLWEFGDGTSLLTQNPTANGVKVYAYSGFPYSTTLTITDVYGCQSIFAPVSISVNENKFLSVASNSAIISPTLSQICSGGSTNICVSSSNPNTPFSYMWNTFATTSCITASQSGVYSVVITDVYGCKSNKPKANINVINVPPPVIFGRQSYCLGDPPLLSINKGTGYNYQWIYSTTDPSMISSTGTYTSTACSSPLFPPPPASCALSPSLNSNATGTLSLTGLITETSSGLNCQAQWGAVTITIHPLPQAPTVGSDGCETGGFITLNATPNGTATISSILWNTGQQGSSINVIPAGSYWASVIDNHGCASEPDTAHIWPLPNFSSLIYGCYDVCDTGITIIPAPNEGMYYPYASYTWLKNGSVFAGPNSFNTPLTLTNPPGKNGVYQLVLTTTHGCTDTSETIDITEKPCSRCNTGGYYVQLDDIVCVYDPVTGLPSYNFQVTVNSPTTSTNFTLTSGNGNLNLNPNTSWLNTGLNTLTGNFIPILGQNRICMHFEIQVNVESTVTCGMDTCFALPECNSLPPCDLEDIDLTTLCIGPNTYDYNLSFYYGGNNGTITITSYQGFMNQSTTIVTTGGNNIIGTFTDTPPFDGVVCFDIVIHSTDADGNDIWCQERVCVQLDQNPPCDMMPPPCAMTMSANPSSICYYVNNFGQITYKLSYGINNPSPSTYSFYVISSSGILGSPAPSTIYPSTSTSYTQSFVMTKTVSPQCFTIIATDLSPGGGDCSLAFCITPDPCDPGQLRLAAMVDVNLYPNPTDDYTVAEYALESRDIADRFTLVDMSGRIIQEVRLEDTRGKLEFNTSTLRAGMYFMKIMNGSETVMVKKLIIQR